jgi:hypothetical protein
VASCPAKQTHDSTKDVETSTSLDRARVWSGRRDAGPLLQARGLTLQFGGNAEMRPFLICRRREGTLAGAEAAIVAPGFC